MSFFYMDNNPVLIVLWAIVCIIVFYIVVRVGSAAVFRSWWQIKSLFYKQQKKEVKEKNYE